MKLPEELWPDPQDRQLVAEAVELFFAVPLVLTDVLTNSVYLNEQAEALFGERAEALVNRAASSLLGYGEKDQGPRGLIQALEGEGAPWRGVAAPENSGRNAFCEASAIRRNGRLVCGVIRLNLR